MGSMEAGAIWDKELSGVKWRHKPEFNEEKEVNSIIMDVEI